MLKPSLRALKYGWLGWSAELQASRSDRVSQINYKPMAFIIGCGRSGTSILGKVFSLHPQVNYLFEPYHLWAAVEKKTDVLNLYSQVEASLLMDASLSNQRSQLRFNHLFQGVSSSDRIKLLLEKTPLNAFRISYIEALAPGSKFVHLVRNGLDVCHSIAQLASTNSYKIVGKPNLNQWWGIQDSKWKALLRDGTIANYHVEEINYLNNHLSRGAYEWLVSLQEVDRWRQTLGERLKELTYDTLTTETESSLKSLCEFFNLDLSEPWLERAISLINSSNSNRQLSIGLPTIMCEAFNTYQERYGFDGRAEYLELNRGNNMELH